MKPIKPYVIGVIGGSGTGKTHFAKYMSDYLDGYFIEADLIGREALVKPELVKAIGDTFGIEMLDEDGMVNRPKLGSVVFGHQEQLSKLNQIMHPVMYKMIEERIKTCGRPVVILEAAVMIEAGFHRLVDDMWYIKADDLVRLQRLIDKRGIDQMKARSMMASGRNDYRDYSDYIIDTTWGLESIQQELNKLLDQVREIRNEKND